MHWDALVSGFVGKGPVASAMLLFFVEQSIWGSSMLNRYSPTHFSQVNRQLTGVYYVASQHAECSPRYMLDGKLSRLSKAFSTGTRPSVTPL